MNLREIMIREGFSDEEKALVDRNGNINDTSYDNAAKILAAKRYERAIGKLIDSNERMAKSNERYSEKIVSLTLVLAVIGILDIYIPLLASDLPLGNKTLITVTALIVCGMAYVVLRDSKQK
jgi:hypothetical protein